MRRFAALSLFIFVACPEAPTEPPAADGGAAILDSGPVAVDAGPEAPNPCGCAEVQTCAEEFLDCLEPEQDLLTYPA